jgi:CBS domain containing-hemolysin-like protein
MFTFLVIISLVAFSSLILVAGIRPNYSPYSYSELERRAKRSDSFKKALERQKILPDIQTLLRVTVALLLLLTVFLLVATFGWLIGVILSVFVVLFYPSLASTKAMKRVSDASYAWLEPHVIRFVIRIEPVFRFLRDTPLYSPEQYHRFDSRDELIELIDAAHEALTPDERKLLASTLQFCEKTVQQVMTPRTVIDSIKQSEFLGPLVLSELHSLGHSRLPVIDGDIDHVVGVLHIRDLLSLDIKRSTTAEKAMEAKVFYIHQDDTLEHALAAFLKVRHHLFIVINDQRETVGLVTLEDVIEALIGRRIVDEDDIHDDLRAVAKRQGVLNNDTTDGIDL